MDETSSHNNYECREGTDTSWCVWQCDIIWLNPVIENCYLYYGGEYKVEQAFKCNTHSPMDHYIN